MASTCCSVCPMPPGNTVQPSACAPRSMIEPAGRHVVAEAVVHQLAGAKAGGVQGARGAPVVGRRALGFVDRCRGWRTRGASAARGRWRRSRRTASLARSCLLQRQQFGLARHRQAAPAPRAKSTCAASTPARMRGEGRRRLLRMRDLPRQRASSARFALLRIARFQCVVVSDRPASCQPPLAALVALHVAEALAVRRRRRPGRTP